MSLAARWGLTHARNVIDEIERRIDVLDPCDSCDRTGWLVMQRHYDGDAAIYTCPCLSENLARLDIDEDAREALIVSDADVRLLPEAIGARHLLQSRISAADGPEWERDS